MSVPDSHRKPSYLLGFDEVTGADCRVYGLICRRRGSLIVTNLPARNGVTSLVTHGWGDDSHARCMQLAIDVLKEFVPQLFELPGDIKALVELFCSDMISTMPGFGGRIEAESIESWLEAQEISCEKINELRDTAVATV